MYENTSMSLFSSERIINWIGDAAKRCMDIVVSIVMLILFSPFFGMIVFAIKHDSPGPIIYRGLRMGRGGKPFKILKFRTMFETPASYKGPKVTAHDDPRITRVGRWLRDTKLNEFPQFWNVLKGDMSLVGPRPEDPTIARTWPKKVWEEVLSIRPGITSPATVHYHNEESLLSAETVDQQYILRLSPDKQRLDQLYVRHRSFWLDLDVMLWTFIIVLPRMSAYVPPEELLFLGLVTRLIRHFISWFTVDALITFSAFGLAGIIWRVSAPLNVGWPTSIALATGFALLFSLVGVFLGVNRISWSKATPADFLDLLPSWIIATVIAFLLDTITSFFPQDLVLVASAMALLGFFTVRYRNHIFIGLVQRFLQFQERSQVIRERVLIIGLGASAQHAAWLLEHMLNSKLFWLVGFVDNDLLKQRMRFYGSYVVGTWKDIPKLVEKYDVGVVIQADYRVETPEMRQIKEICAQTPARLVVLPDILVSVNRLVKPSAGARRVTTGSSAGADPACLDCLAKCGASSRKQYWRFWKMRIAAGGLLAADSNVRVRRKK